MPERLLNPHNQLAENLFWGIGFTTLERGGNHLAILYKTSEGWRVLHQYGGIFDSSIDADKLRFVLADPSDCLLPAELEQLFDQTRNVSRSSKSGKLPYGISHYSGWFKANGSLEFRPDDSGLTCSGFVLSVIDSLGIRLMDDSTWPFRLKDHAFVDELIRMVGRVAPSHVSKIEAERGRFLRFRPEEVAGAAISSKIPCEFAVAETKALEVLKFMISTHGQQMRN